MAKGADAAVLDSAQIFNPQPHSMTRRGIRRPKRLMERILHIALIHLPHALLTAGLLSGCASMAPRFETPPLPVASIYNTAPHAGQSAAETAWREYFAEPRLQALIEQALANNRDLRTAVLRVEEARAAHGIQRAERFPALNAQGGMERSRVPADLNLTGKPLLGNVFQVELGMASWEIDFWGRVRSLQDAALQEYLATDAAQRAATLSLITQVANSYLVLCEIDERIALAGQTLASRTESLRIFTRRVEVGATSRLDQTQVESLLTQARALAAQLEQARAAQWNALTLLVGAPISFPGTAAHVAFPELNPGLPSALLLERPDILAAEHQLRAANANIGAARAAFFPRVALTASLGTASAELDGLFANGSTAWQFSPTLSLPLFDGGRRKNNLSLAETRRDLAIASYEKSVQTAFRDVADALSARLWQARQLGIGEEALRIQTQRARLSRLRYDSGASAFLEVLDAEREQLVSEQQVVQLRRALRSSQVSLYAALGGGSLASSSMPASTADAHESSPGKYFP